MLAIPPAAPWRVSATAWSGSSTLLWWSHTESISGGSRPQLHQYTQTGARQELRQRNSIVLRVNFQNKMLCADLVSTRLEILTINAQPRQITKPFNYVAHSITKTDFEWVNKSSNAWRSASESLPVGRGEHETKEHRTLVVTKKFSVETGG